MSAQPLLPKGAIARTDDLILVTGAAGFIGRRVVEKLLALGYTRVRCLVRPVLHGNSQGWSQGSAGAERNEVITGNLLSADDCLRATEGAKIVIHLAAGRGQKSFADAFLNSVVTTRNLLDAIVRHGCVRRLVSVSSFAVYSNQGKSRRDVLNESSQIEVRPHLRGEAYCYAKAKQEALVLEYAAKYKVPSVIVRPGVVFGPGNRGITGRVGLDTFGFFLHLGGSNPVPLTYVDNCAEAIVLAALAPEVDGESFNVVDDDLPTSRHFLSLYKKHVRSFRSVWVPRPCSYLLCYLWERYSAWSEGQLPPAFNRLGWHAYWKGSRYSNEKLKRLTGWKPQVPMNEALRHYFESCIKRNGES
jgi:nucleoside-diphosphate-sugar epimerase